MLVQPYHVGTNVGTNVVLKKTATKRSNENIILCSLSLPDTDRMLAANIPPTWFPVTSV